MDILNYWRPTRPANIKAAVDGVIVAGAFDSENTHRDGYLRVLGWKGGRKAGVLTSSEYITCTSTNENVKPPRKGVFKKNVYLVSSDLS